MDAISVGEPMLARRADELPVGDYLYEPKWDGFRCLAATGEPIALWSRHGRPLARYYPEVVAALHGLERRALLDGELVIGDDFNALLGRLHPAASRVAELARSHPATFVAFDLLVDGEEDLRSRPFALRRERLEALVTAPAANLLLSPITDDEEVAKVWLSGRRRGIDGVVAKARRLTYQHGKRVMVKIKPTRTVDCVVAGFRLRQAEPAVSSLLLGLYDGPTLRHVGVVSAFSGSERRRLLVELEGTVVPLAGHPWQHGFNLTASPTGRLPGSASRWDPATMARDWIPVRPERVVEVSYDTLDVDRFRHAAKLVRWRPDREPSSCRFEQLR